MSKRNLTIDDVAKAAGVARVTVSRVLNNGPNVRPETRRRVEQAVEASAIRSICIMFPTIFTITLERSGVSHTATSGLLCVAIFGGALLPMTVGATADRFGLSMAFIVPLAAYAVIACFAVAARKSEQLAISPEPEMNLSPIP